jgi:hypothetical protein
MYPDYHRPALVRDVFDPRSQRALSRAAARRYAQLEAVGAVRSGRGTTRWHHNLLSGAVRALRRLPVLRGTRRPTPTASRSSMRS